MAKITPPQNGPRAGFTSLDEVELVFGITLTGNQAIMVLNYIQNGIRPEAGCDWCDSGFIRKLTGKMDQYIIKVEAGEAEWPWPNPPVEEPIEIKTEARKAKAPDTGVSADTDRD